VNLSEVVAKLADRGTPRPEVEEIVANLDLRVHPFVENDAVETGLLRPITKGAGLSLGDRACLALASRLGLVVVTMDRSWARLALPVTVRMLRPDD
jgi:PIN domain nuclease of toxin-antitoxin system